MPQCPTSEAVSPSTKVSITSVGVLKCWSNPHYSQKAD